MPRRAGRDQRADKARARARVQIRQARADQRDRRRLSRQRDPRRQPAGFDGIELATKSKGLLSSEETFADSVAEGSEPCSLLLRCDLRQEPSPPFSLIDPN